MSNSTIEQDLSEWTRGRFARLFPGMDLAAVRPEVSAATDDRFGDYQCNAAMPLSKLLRKPPREIAKAFVEGADLPEFVSRIEIAGAGFINFWISEGWLARRLHELQSDETFAASRVGQGRTVVIDYSGPNIAKPMHIGHIRSMSIGNALERMHRFLGYNVITDNHVGDWGTQFGILLLGWKNELDPTAIEADAVAEMERLYKKVFAACEADPALRERAKNELVKLQDGDTENTSIWEKMKALSESHFNDVYRRLGVSFDHTLGESFYNSRMAGVVDALVAKGIARISNGATCVFSEGKLDPKDDAFLIQRDGEWQPNPCIIRKSDGAFNYETSDLAALAYRMETWNPTEIIYVTDARQQLHFRHVFEIFRRWYPDASVKLQHIWFGTILGEDGKPIKTRSGESVKLLALLDEAEQKAFDEVTLKSPELNEPARRSIARIVGIGAIKYADLSPNRNSDYMFVWNKMLSMEGNTAPYLQYACARVASVIDKYAERFPGRAWNESPITLVEPLERKLAMRIARFPDVVIRAADTCRPNALCEYLFELAQVYSSFYQNVPFLKAEDGVRESRVRLCDLVARALRTGLGLLGIETPTRI